MIYLLLVIAFNCVRLNFVFQLNEINLKSYNVIFGIDKHYWALYNFWLSVYGIKVDSIFAKV
jgi:hypothetical protein